MRGKDAKNLALFGTEEFAGNYSERKGRKPKQEKVGWLEVCGEL